MPSSELSGVFCYVYVLYSISSTSTYIGFTKDIDKRIAKHNNGLIFSTKPYIPWQLIYYEAHASEDDARRREKYLKTSSGRMALSRMLRGKLLEVKKLNHQKVYC